MSTYKNRQKRDTFKTVILNACKQKKTPDGPTLYMQRIILKSVLHYI